MNRSTLMTIAVAILSLFLSTIGVMSASARAEAAGVTVTIDAPAEVVAGSSFAVDVDISGVTSLDAGQFDVSFDDTVIQLDAVGAGQIGTTQIPVAIWNMTSPGVCRIVVNVPGVPGVSGSGQLATLTFRAVGSAGTSSSIAISDGFLANNLAVQITATWTGDSLSVWNDLTIVNESLPGAVVGTPYSAKVSAKGGNGDYTWSVLSGSLPGGISFSSDGSLSGTATTVGTCSVTFKVTDGHLSDEKSLNIVVSPRLGDANGDGTVNTADITKVERMIVGLEATITSGDANQDDKVNVADITSIERIICGLS